MRVRSALLDILSDGQFHSGEVLGARLGVTRAAVWKQLRTLSKLGLTIHAVRGRGYQLAYPIDLLESETIYNHLPPYVRDLIPHIDILSQIDSTNSVLKQRAVQGAATGAACLAEQQTAGRGRQGRHWVSPFGCNLYLSLLWRFSNGPTSLAGLSLAMGVALARAIRATVSEQVCLKWPNDLVWKGQKLAGILVEIAGESAGPSYAVIGVGVNVRMPSSISTSIDQPWTDLYRLSRETPSRNALAASVLEHLVSVLRDFEQQGLAAFLDEWRELDSMAGHSVELQTPTGVIAGQAQGIDQDGSLLIQIGNEVHRFASGEVSLRMSP